MRSLALTGAVPCLAAVAAACGGDLSAPQSNVPPVAAFGSSCADLACTFSDSSLDADGRIAAYRWSFGDQSSGGTSRNAEHTYAVPGTYTVALTVTDDNGATDSVARVLRAVPPNALPVASFGGSCAALTCTYSDSSSDPDGRIAGYRWSFGDGSAEETTRDADHTYAAPGAYTVSLTVTDDDGATGIATRVVQAVLPPNAPPVASFGSSCVDLTCNFGDSSSDTDGSVVSHHWAFGDGEEADAPSPAHTYASAGVYVVRLAVTDDRGAITSAEQEVTVTALPARGPAIALSDSSIRFCYAPGSTRNCVFLVEDIRLTSSGGGALRWTASGNQPWLVVSPAMGMTPTRVRVSVDLRKLPPRTGFSLGVFGAITVSADRASNSPLTIPVFMSYVASRLSSTSEATVLHAPAPAPP